PWTSSSSGRSPPTAGTSATPSDHHAANKEGDAMAIGPVHLLGLGFNHPNLPGEVIQEPERLRESNTVRVIDALAVHKDANGELEVAHLSNLTEEEAVELGTKVGALIGVGIGGE